MKKLLGGVIISLGLLTTSAAQAELNIAQMYAGVSFADGNVIGKKDSEKRRFGNLGVAVGMQLFEFLGAELQAGFASDQADSMVSEPLVEYQAALGRVNYRFDRVGLYGLAGLARLKFDDSIGKADPGRAFGFGVNLFGNETTAINFQHMNYDNGAYTTTSVGFQYYFGGFR